MSYFFENTLLPPEIWQKIFLSVSSLNDLLRTAKVCRQFYTLIKNELFLRKYCTHKLTQDLIVYINFANNDITLVSNLFRNSLSGSKNGIQNVTENNYPMAYSNGDLIERNHPLFGNVLTIGSYRNRIFYENVFNFTLKLEVILLKQKHTTKRSLLPYVLPRSAHRPRLLRLHELFLLSQTRPNPQRVHHHDGHVARPAQLKILLNGLNRHRVLVGGELSDGLLVSANFLEVADFVVKRLDRHLERVRAH